MIPVYSPDEKRKNRMRACHAFCRFSLPKEGGFFYETKECEILALTDAELSARLDEFRRQQTQKVLDATI